MVCPEDYQHAQRVWEAAGVTTLGEYRDLYLKMDVLLLADVLENFRSVCHRIYKLDLAWSFTARGLAFQGMLKVSGVELKLLLDYDMYLFLRQEFGEDWFNAQKDIAKTITCTSPTHRRPARRNI